MLHKGRRGRLAGILVHGTAVMTLVGSTGCSTAPTARSAAQSVDPAAESRTNGPEGTSQHDSGAQRLYAANAVTDADVPVAQEPIAKDAPPDEYYDPFAKPGEGSAEDEYDPWEPFNSAMFEFNRKVDKWVLKPVAQGYNFVLPDAVQVSVSNFIHNIRFVPRFMNNLLQGKFKGAGIEMERFLINSTFGVAGIYDVAKEGWNLQTPDEDTGQTLGFYGVKPGPYLVLPFLPPLNLRDAVGFTSDIALDPINWFVFPIVEIEEVPSLIAHKNRTTFTFGQLGVRVGEIVNERSLNLEKFQGVEEATLDLYTAVRNAYLQKRARAIRE